MKVANPHRHGLDQATAQAGAHEQRRVHLFGRLVKADGGALRILDHCDAADFANRYHRRAGFRAELDESNEKLGYKIRHWKTQKVPYILVAGKREVEEGSVNVNQRGTEEKRNVSVGDFVEELQTLVEARR